MKKAGSLKSKSKTPPTKTKTKAKKTTIQKTKSTTPKSDEQLSEALSEMAVGHSPRHSLAPQDAEVFRAFQANLLSLINHELRTPLMNIINSLNMMTDDAGEAFSREELVAIARGNAQRLLRTLSALLDLASLESGTFHVRLREVELGRLVRARLEASAKWLRDRELRFQVEDQLPEGGAAVLADPVRLSRALELCLESILPRARVGSAIEVSVTPSRVSVVFSLDPGSYESWTNACSLALAGFQGGVFAPGSAFAGTLQSEQAFLSRSEEGLGSEFLLLYEIMRMHRGEFKVSESHEPGDFRLELFLPELTSEQGLEAVLASRAHSVSNELGTVALGLIEIPDEVDAEEYRARLKRYLFRSSDAVYLLAEKRRLALVLDDCKPGDAPKLLKRISDSMGERLVYGVSACPDEGVEPEVLIRIAEKRLREGQKPGA